MLIAVVRAARRAVVSRHDPEPDARFHHAADRIEAPQLNPQAERLADPAGLVGQEALKGARPVEPDEIVVQHLGE